MTQTMIEKLTWDIWSEYAGTLTMYDAKNIVKQILEGLREPTEEMRRAVFEVCESDDRDKRAERAGFALFSYQSAIDAALQEKG